MQIKIFKPFLTVTDTFDNNFVGIINKIESITINKNTLSIGDFTLAFAVMDNVVIKPEYVLWVIDRDFEYWLIAKNITINRKTNICNVTGTDLKGYLSYRITLYSKKQDTGTYGYDVVTGSTEECCIHYIKNNIINPVDTNRRIPRLLLTQKSSHSIGIANDSYMSRFEYVSDVIKKLCSNAHIWWDIIADTDNNCFRFDVFDIIDKSSLQSIYKPIVFSKARKNLSDYEYESGNCDLKNVFYATKSGGALVADATTVAVIRDGETISSGILRKEMHLNVSCDDVTDIATYARHDAEEYKANESLTFNVATANGFGTDYYLGDKVTVFDAEDNIKMDAVITSASITKSRTVNSLKLTVGTAKTKPITKINNNIKNRGV